jgi:hypothetical protein
MIEGLKFKVTAQEIKEHLQARSQYHENRANEKEAELPTLEALIEKLTGEPAGKLTNQGKARFSGTYGFDPESQMDAIRNDIRHHRSKASKFLNPPCWRLGRVFASHTGKCQCHPTASFLL